MISLTKAAGLGRWTGFAAGLALATALVAQTVNQQQPGDVPNSAANLKIPADAQILGNADPNVRKPTAIVNDAVITGTDVDQRVRSEEHTSELQSLMRISYAVFCLKKKKITNNHNRKTHSALRIIT